MQPRSENERAARGDGAGTHALRPARGETRRERMHEIRLRLADDVYRSAGVAEVIARRILASRDL